MNLPLRRLSPAVLFVVLLFAQVFHPSVAFAQSESAAMSGRVTDQSGAVLAGVEVEVKNADTNVSQKTTTNHDGYYSLPSLRPGHYIMTVRKQSFRSVAVTGITLNVQDNLSRNFALQVGSFAESITVQAEGINVNTTDGTVSTVVDHKFVEAIPLNGRSFQDLLTLAPGVAITGAVSNGNTAALSNGKGGVITVNGQRTEANYFTVDGVSANVGSAARDFGFGAGYSGSTPGTTAFGTTQSLISVDALQEFRASTSTYSAEYGRTPGGQFSFTTRSGTNDWHGSVYEYFRNEVFDANDWFLNRAGKPRQKERQNDFGGTLGGPLSIPAVYDGKNKTFFFVSYEGLRLWTPHGLQSVVVPDADLRANAPDAVKPLLNAFPLPTSAGSVPDDGLGLYQAGISDPSTIDSLSVRVDHKLSEKLNLFGRFANSPSYRRSSQDASPTTVDSNYRTLTAGLTTRITQSQINEFRFNVTRSYFSNVTSFPEQGGALPFDIGALPGPNGGPFPVDASDLFVCLCFGEFGIAGASKTSNRQYQYNVTDTHSLGIGSHMIQFGVDWRRISTWTPSLTVSETAEFDSVEDVLNNAMFGGVSVSSPDPYEPVYKNFSLFAQDDWKATPSLSLSFGLRWDVNPAPTNATGPSPYTVDQIDNLSTTKLAPAGTPLWHTDWLGLAPRFGLAYALRNSPGRETVLRGGWGMFYDTGNSRGSTGYAGIGISTLTEFPGVSFPLTSEQLTLPPPSIEPPYNTTVYGFDPHLKLPYTMQWNFSVQQTLGEGNSLTVGYLGAVGRRLLTTFSYSPEEAGNPNFSADACPGCLYITKNGASSDYHSLQIEFQRRVSRGLRMLGAYTWSHSIDSASSNFFLTDQLQRASSDFDIRHNVQIAVTYDLPGRYSNRGLGAILENWGLDTRVSIRSGLPINIIGSQSLDPNTHTFNSFHPDRVSGEPSRLFGPQYPGGWILNYNAYQPAPDGVEGNVGRNSERGFGAAQVNLSLRREFPIRERLRLQFRAEAFNVFNHPNFGWVVNDMSWGACPPFVPGQSNVCFGAASQSLNRSIGGLDSLYQVGGPRSLQLALKVQF